jgi:D-alanine-D-alanine ligase
MSVMTRPLVAVMLGGPSSEHEVSLASGARVLEQLDTERFEGAPIFVDRQAGWHFGERPWRTPGSDWLTDLARTPTYRPGGSEVLPWRPDVVFNALHGAYGEDGQLQTQLEQLGIRYTGSGPEASRLAMNKALARERFVGAGLTVARGWEVPDSEAPTDAARRILADFSGPFVVKPRDGGSSVGVRMTTGERELIQALTAAAREGLPSLVEERVEGIELTCGVLEEVDDGAPSALPVTEIVPPQGGFFDYAAKYTAGVSQEITPARIEPQSSARVQSMAIAAHRTLGCSAYSRSDFILRPSGEAVLIELNTLPGLTATSLLPQGAAQIGLGYRELLTRIVELALRR